MSLPGHGTVRRRGRLERRSMGRRDVLDLLCAQFGNSRLRRGGVVLRDTDFADRSRTV